MNGHPSTDIHEHNLPILTVSEISNAIRRCVESSFEVVRVRGEVSGAKRAASGHLYFALKDEDAVLDAVCWRPAAAQLSVAPEDGLEVIVSGRLTTYPSRSKYQIIVDAIELSGAAALLKLLEDRRRKLAQEGLFEPSRKKPLPFLPEVIGVVTSPTGAVIRDILHRLADRFPRRVLLWPVLVQGSGAAEQVAAAVEGFNRLPSKEGTPRPDVLIVARGGGSLEDLWPFNEEIVVRAVAASAIPVISAVGHETDTTLIDFAADRRAPTPTAAAEIAVPVRIELLGRVMTNASRLVAAINRTLTEQRVRLDGLGRGLPQPARLIGDARQRLDDWGERLRNGLLSGIARRRAELGQLAARLQSPGPRIDHARTVLAGEARALNAAIQSLLRDCQRRVENNAALLESFSYHQVLKRGFALVYDQARNPVTSAAPLKPGMALALRFADGEAGVTVSRAGDGAGNPQGAGPEKPPARAKKPAKDSQGELF